MTTIRRSARFTEAEIRRAIRAAKKECVRVVLRPDGSIEIDPKTAFSEADVMLGDDRSTLNIRL